MVKGHISGNIKSEGTISGGVNVPVLLYTGEETATAKVLIDNKWRTIAVDVKQLPHDFTVEDRTTEEPTVTVFNGSEDKAIILKDWIVREVTPTSQDTLAEYALFRDGEEYGDRIIVPRDKVITGIILSFVDENNIAQVQTQCPEAQIGDPFLDITVQNYSGTEDFHYYVLLIGVVDTYVAGKGLTLTYVVDQDGRKVGTFDADIDQEDFNNLDNRKADKVIAESGQSTDGEVAGLDETGNLTDSGIAISDVVTRSGAQTVDGVKTFTPGINFTETANPLRIVANGNYNLNVRYGENGILASFGTSESYISGLLRPGTDNYSDLGTSSKQWKDLYLAGNLSDGTNSISVDSIVNDKANKVVSGSGETTENKVAGLDINGDLINSNIDISDVATQSGDNTFTGTNTFDKYSKTKLNSTYYWQFGSEDYNFHIERYNGSTRQAYYDFTNDMFFSNGKDIGGSNYPWKDLYLSGKVDFGNNATITKDSSNRINLNYGNDAKVKVGSGATIFKGSIVPDALNSYSLGQASLSWLNLQMTGVIKNGNVTYGIGLPDMTNWSADKTIATTDDITSAINNLNYGPQGSDGNYIKVVQQTNGVLSATPESFDTQIDNSSDNTNAPTSQAVREFVNSSIATETANFRGTFNLIDDLHLTRTATHEEVATALLSVVGIATNNDYCYVWIPDEVTPTQAIEYDKYKYTVARESGEVTGWGFEFALNNSSFTQAQWAAINSTITKAKVDDMALQSQANTFSQINTFSSGIKTGSIDNSAAIYFKRSGISKMVFTNSELRPDTNLGFNLGNDTYKWNNLYLGGTAYTPKIEDATSITFRLANADKMYLNAGQLMPATTNAVDLGRSDVAWKDAYLSGILNINQSSIQEDNNAKLNVFGYGGLVLNTNGSPIQVNRSISFSSDNNKDIGTSSVRAKDIHIAGQTYYYYPAENHNTYWSLHEEEYDNLAIARNGSDLYKFGSQSFFPASNNVRDIGTSDLKFKNLYLSGNTYIGNLSIYADNSGTPHFSNSTTSLFTFDQTVQTGILRPSTNSTHNLGIPTLQWKNFFLSGYIGNSNSGFGLTIPDTTSFTENKTIATTDLTTNLSNVKANKVIAQESGEIINGNLAGLNADGDLTNSGIAITNVPLLDASNTFSGDNTFSNGVNTSIIKNSGTIGIRPNNVNYNLLAVSTTEFLTWVGIRPATGSQDLGTSGSKWQDLYLSRNLTDGTNSITIANIQEKVQVMRFI